MRGEVPASLAARRPSLRRRLLLFLLLPMLVFLVLDAILTYTVALGYSNRVGDEDLVNDVRSLAQMLRTERLGGALSDQARFLLEYDPDGHNYFRISSSRHGVLSGNGAFPVTTPPGVDSAPVLFDSTLGKHPLRAAAISVASPTNPTDVLTITIAETLHDRRQRAGEILWLAIPMQALLIICLLSLVWFGVTYGLRILQPLTRRLAAREHELGPISDADVPSEILPLTQTIDALFERLRDVLAAQERFIADAAHQLRTPLAGLSIHVERALGDADADTVNDSLRHIARLTQRATRTSSQLLAMTRAQAPVVDVASTERVDLVSLVLDALDLRVHEALRANIELAYQGTEAATWIDGDAAVLHDLLNNLIDNALRYAGPGSAVTVDVQQREDGGATLSVEDNGPGVAPDLLPRLGERFFRVPGSGEGGTGLGLAIVKRIAQQHHAIIVFGTCAPHGLRVQVQFPAPSKGA